MGIASFIVVMVSVPWSDRGHIVDRMFFSAP